MGCGCTEDKYTWNGTGLKYAVRMDCEGFDMNEDDWIIVITCGDKSVTFSPENAVYNDSENQWYICINTEELGPGELYITFEAHVPDEDFPVGYRREIQKYRLVKIKNL